MARPSTSTALLCLLCLAGAQLLPGGSSQDHSLDVFENQAYLDALKNYPHLEEELKKHRMP